MGKLIELSPEQKSAARGFEVPFKTLILDPGNRASSLEGQLLPHFDDTLHVYRDNGEGNWQNGFVAKIDTTEELENGLPIHEAETKIIQQLIGLKARAIVFSRERDLLPPELHSHNGA